VLSLKESILDFEIVCTFLRDLKRVIAYNRGWWRGRGGLVLNPLVLMSLSVLVWDLPMRVSIPVPTPAPIPALTPISLPIGVNLLGRIRVALSSAGVLIPTLVMCFRFLHSHQRRPALSL
jgi:hypothetical protein